MEVSIRICGEVNNFDGSNVTRSELSPVDLAIVSGAFRSALRGAFDSPFRHWCGVRRVLSARPDYKKTREKSAINAYCI